jgi:hypothetical protein
LRFSTQRFSKRAASNGVKAAKAIKNLAYDHASIRNLELPQGLHR